MKKNLFKAIFKAAWRIPVGYIFWMKRYANDTEQKIPMELKYKKLRKVVSKVTYALDSDVIVSGKENVPNETCAFFSNHLAAPDPLPIITTLDAPMAFLAKTELEKVPYASTAIKSIEGLFLKRDDLKQSLRTMMKIEEDLKNKRKNWLIFPEGTRNKDDKAVLLEFHHGTFRPAMKAGVPIVPIAVFGAQRLFDKKNHFKKYPIHLIFGKPLYPKDYEGLSTQEVAQIVQSKIQQMLTYEARKNDRAYLATINDCFFLLRLLKEVKR